MAFLLAGEKGERDEAGGEGVRSQAERQIFGYIRGKVGISLLVALVHAGVLRLVP